MYKMITTKNEDNNLSDSVAYNGFITTQLTKGERSGNEKKVINGTALYSAAI